MSRGFVEVGRGSAGTGVPVPLGRPLEEVLGFADAVETDAGDDGAAPAGAAAEPLVAAAGAEAEADGAPLAIVTVAWRRPLRSRAALA